MKRSIFEKAAYGREMRKRLDEEKNLIVRARELESQVIPTVPLDDTPMEVETSLPPGDAPLEVPEPRESAERNIERLFEEALRDIKVTLNAPEGYILFPEPPQDEAEDKPSFEVVPSE